MLSWQNDADISAYMPGGVVLPLFETFSWFANRRMIMRTSDHLTSLHISVAFVENIYPSFYLSSFTHFFNTGCRCAVQRQAQDLVRHRAHTMGTMPVLLTAHILVCSS